MADDKKAAPKAEEPKEATVRKAPEPKKVPADDRIKKLEAEVEKARDDKDVSRGQERIAHLQKLIHAEEDLRDFDAR